MALCEPIIELIWELNGMDSRDDYVVIYIVRRLSFSPKSVLKMAFYFSQIWTLHVSLNAGTEHLLCDRSCATQLVKIQHRRFHGERLADLGETSQGHSQGQAAVWPSGS